MKIVCDAEGDPSVNIFTTRDQLLRKKLNDDCLCDEKCDQQFKCSESLRLVTQCQMARGVSKDFRPVPIEFGKPSLRLNISLYREIFENIFFSGRCGFVKVISANAIDQVEG